MSATVPVKLVSLGALADPVPIGNGGSGTTTAALSRAAFGAMALGAAVDISAAASDGDGTSGSPWVIAPTLASYTAYYFPAGHYSIANTLAITDLLGVSLIGAPNAVFLHWTGSAGGTMIELKTVSVDTSVATWYHTIRGFVLDGNKTALLGIRGYSAHHCVFEDIRAYHIKGTNSAVMKLEGCVNPSLDRVTSRYEDYDSSADWPDYGLWMKDRTGVGYTVSAVVNNMQFRGTQKHGLYIDGVLYATFNSGGLEFCGNGGSGYGVYIAAGTSAKNTFNSVSVESSSNGGLFLNGAYNTFNSFTAINGPSILGASASANVFNSGEFTSLVLQSGAQYNDFRKVAVQDYNLTDSSANLTNSASFFNDLTGNYSIKSRQEHAKYFEQGGSGSRIAYPNEITYVQGTTGTITLFVDATVYTIGKVYFLVNLASGTFVVTSSAAGGISLKGTTGGTTNVNLTTGSRMQLIYDGYQFFEF